jgi:hypothetical protein
MANTHLTDAKNAKNDEFYTQYHDIEKEINAYLEYNPNAFKDKIILLPCDDPEWSNFTKYFAQNFKKLKLKKLISTSYAIESKNYKDGFQTTLFEERSPKFDKKKTRIKGKIFTLTKDKTGDNKINIDDLDWEYLEGDGDFRSKEVKKLRDEADIIVTNPPFSLFREFLSWIIEAKKQFLIIGNMNVITYKEVFPLIKDNKMWLGISSGAKTYIKPDKTEQKLGNTCWFTNLEHGRRHQPLPLMSREDNLKFNQKMKGKEDYDKYSNYDAIEIQFSDAIPSDYKGVMGVPISFLEKYNPEQFEIIGSNLTHGVPMSEIAKKGTFAQGGPSFYTDNGDGTFKRIYTRILIKHKKIKSKK